MMPSPVQLLRHARFAVGTALLLTAAALPAHAATSTPIQHVVVLFQENVSFDHYFATYPVAANPAGQPAFAAASGTPTVNGLSDAQLHHNPNSVQPLRLDRSQNYTCDQDHDYMPEQQAFNGGLMNRFVETVGTGSGSFACPDYGLGKGIVMGYYDGNTVTALWNYAQAFALNDNSYGTTFGPSTPGALNLISGQTGRMDRAHTKGNLGDSVIGNTVIGDPDPFYDDCSGSTQVSMRGKNVGDLLNTAGVTWGWFEGGFAPTSHTGSTAVCGAKTNNLSGAAVSDYSAHHQPFQYYLSTSNPHHLPPSSVAMIGHTDQANHQYDLNDFWAAVNAGNMPAVSYLKAKKSQDGHAGYSSPLDEQIFIVNTINALQQRPEWASTAVIIAYDDSDGWYDHQMSPIMNQSASEVDALVGEGSCGSLAGAMARLVGRCGYGPRLPLLVVSPWAKTNFVDHTTTDQTSILRFIEDNWGLGQIGRGSFDALAGSLTGMFDWTR
ncbi:MAG TPA: alkaline phosphatase family protein, partial [Thermoanaerobaculia bacterium]